MTSMRRIRFVDDSIQELQQMNRKSLLGCENLPLMSLEEAVKTIVDFQPTVTDDTKKAKEHCRKNTILTPDESAAVYLYTMDRPFYRALNQALRAENPQALEPWSAYLKLLITALRKLPSCSTTMWRGVAGEIGSEFSQNTIYTWESITSCSSQMNVAACFADQQGILFCINTIHGKDITKYSEFQGEREIILMPGTCLRVKSASLDINGLYVVHLDEW